jgi:hypothetical protein
MDKILGSVRRSCGAIRFAFPGVEAQKVQTSGTPFALEIQRAGVVSLPAVRKPAQFLIIPAGGILCRFAYVSMVRTSRVRKMRP